MSQYATTVKRLSQESEPPEIVKDWRCQANGCPNAGSMDGKVCFFHWRETDSSKWGALTQQIRENFDSMRNWGQLSPELQAKHRAQSQKLFAGMRADRPRGLANLPEKSE